MTEDPQDAPDGPEDPVPASDPTPDPSAAPEPSEGPQGQPDDAPPDEGEVRTVEGDPEPVAEGLIAALAEGLPPDVRIAAVEQTEDGVVVAVERIEPAGEASPFYLREWRGSALYGCPVCRDAGSRTPFVGRSHRAVARHVDFAHREPDRSIEQRARDSGIALARR